MDDKTTLPPAGFAIPLIVPVMASDASFEMMTSGVALGMLKPEPSEAVIVVLPSATPPTTFSCPNEPAEVPFKVVLS